MNVIILKHMAATNFLLLAVLSGNVVAFHPNARRSPAWAHFNIRSQCYGTSLQHNLGHLAPDGGDPSGLDSVLYSTGQVLAKASSALVEVPPIPEYRASTTDTRNFESAVSSAVGIESPLPDTSDSSKYMRDVIQSVVDSWQQGYKATVGSIHNAPRSPGSAPSLAEYIREGRFHPEETINRLRNLQGLNIDNFVQQLGRAQQSLLHGVDAEGKGLEKISQFLQKIPVEKMAQSIQNFVLALQTPSEDTVQASLKALDLDELGGWYVGSLGVLWFISQSSISMSSKKSLEQKLSEATEVLDKEAKVAELKVQSLLTEKERMENQVKELSKATISVSEELKELKLEKASRDYAVAEMKSELRSLKNELKSRQLKEKEVVSQLTKAETKLKAETQKLRRELEERKAMEETLQERIRELQAQLGTDAVAGFAQDPKESAPEPKLVASKSKTTKSRKSSTKTPKAIDQMAEPVQEPSAEPQGVYFASVEEPAVPIPSNTAPAKTTRKTTAKKVKEVTKSDADMTSAPPSKGTKSTLKTLTKKATSKSTSDKKAKLVEEPSVDLSGIDWSKLTPAAVRRKSISELSDYLLAKGETVKDDTGKALKKADLVEKVLSTL